MVAPASQYGSSGSSNIQMNRIVGSVFESVTVSQKQDSIPCFSINADDVDCKADERFFFFVHK